MNETARHVVFRGKVQGVGFRFTSRNIAGRHNLTGMVRNLPDGNVEMFVQGQDKAVSECIKEIQEYFSGYITDTITEEISSDSKYKDFRIGF
jgi:acylphosphatase